LSCKSEAGRRPFRQAAARQYRTADLLFMPAGCESLPEAGPAAAGEEVTAIMKLWLGPMVLVLCAGQAPAQDVQEGLRLAVANCSRCHALGEHDASPFADAPPFRDIPQFYGAGELEQAFNEGFVVAHPAMPEWTMTPAQARALAAFIMSFGPAKEE
jgi:mono/diheme cytochrome c family protein